MLFEEQESRKPDQYPMAEKFMRAMWEGHWTSNEFSFKRDVQHFKVKLNQNHNKNIICHWSN
jgi:ribonucleotide reductase beta subunit family protein with ferritin-like domain